jgi:ADP-ribose pyrophosphatase
LVNAVAESAYKRENMPMVAPYKALSSRVAWSCPWYSVRQDEIVLPNGETAVYNVVQHPGAVFIVPLTADGQIVLIRHYRYTVQDWCWELPAGGLKKGQSPEEAAYEELREEIGGTADALHYVGQFYSANGVSDEIIHVFIASGVTLGPPQHEPVELIEIYPTSLAEALRMARANEISDGPSALALLISESKIMQIYADKNLRNL